MTEDGLYIVLLSIHGLIRGDNLELGRDVDTGGQTKYVVELAKALGQQANVSRVDLITRLIKDPQISLDYAQPIEELSPTVRIVRIEAGPDEYLAKEQLWDHLDVFADNLFAFLHNERTHVSVLHSHYADAGYVGLRVARGLGLLWVHTGHSLGRDKRRRLLAAGLSTAAIERRYNISHRIQAEEEILSNANLIIASTQQEIEEQYARYDFYRPESMIVVPPGTDTSRFRKTEDDESDKEIAQQINRFLDVPNKPLILALARPDPRKNLKSLVEAYGENKQLQELANLVIIAGNRTDIRDLDTGAQEVWTELLLLFDAYDLYGKVAYPKAHQPNDVPSIYRMATNTQGIFVNSAVTEPFGLTLLEAAASGLPVVATDDGGPREILKHCKNGFLFDALNKEELTEKLLGLLTNKDFWQSCSDSGVEAVAAHYSWRAHASSYIKHVIPLARTITPSGIEHSKSDVSVIKHRDRAIVLPIDHILDTHNEQILEAFQKQFTQHRKDVCLVYLSQRHPTKALERINKYRYTLPDVWISETGTAIYYGRDLVEDEVWTEILLKNWHAKAIKRVLGSIDGVQLLPRHRRFNLEFQLDGPDEELKEMIGQRLQEQNLTATISGFKDSLIQLTPNRASYSAAIRWFSHIWDIPLERILVSHNMLEEEELLRGNLMGAILGGNCENEQKTDVYITKEQGLGGVLEAAQHYQIWTLTRINQG